MTFAQTVQVKCHNGQNSYGLWMSATDESVPCWVISMIDDEICENDADSGQVEQGGSIWMWRKAETFGTPAMKTISQEQANIMLAIRRGLDAGGDSEDWDAPEFADARKLTEGYQWEFESWETSLRYMIDGALDKWKM